MSNSGKQSFSLSTGARHFGVVGLQTEFWLPNMSTPWIACVTGMVFNHCTGRYDKLAGGLDCSYYAPDAQQSQTVALCPDPIIRSSNCSVLLYQRPPSAQMNPYWTASCHDRSGPLPNEW